METTTITKFVVVDEFGRYLCIRGLNIWTTRIDLAVMFSSKKEAKTQYPRYETIPVHITFNVDK